MNKKLIAIFAIGIFFAACAGADHHADENKKVMQDLSTRMSQLEKEVTAYCDCASTKTGTTIGECQAELDKLSNTHSSLINELEKQYVGMVLETKQFDSLKQTANDLFDKKAACAMEAMGK